MSELFEFVHNVVIHPLVGITRVLYVAAQWLHDRTILDVYDEPDYR